MTRCPNIFGAPAVLLAAALILPSLGHAALKCEEVVTRRVCSDSAPKAHPIPGGSTMVAAPVITGFPTACWNWNREFQCVETEPVQTCVPDADFNTVKDTCSLTAATVNATVTINALTYITDATYTYKCAFGDFTTAEQLPTGKDCVMLNTATTDGATAPAAPLATEPATVVGSGTTTAPLTTTIVTSETKVDGYVCYSPPTTVCADTCYKTVVDKVTGKAEQQPVACTALVTNCVTSSDQCANTLPAADGSGATVDLGPDGRCVNSEKLQMCQNGEVPRCLAEENCTLSSSAPADIQDNGVAMAQTQTYICTNETTSCTKFASISNCVHSNAWGWDKMGIPSEVGAGLGEVNQAMAKADAIQKGMNESDPYVFSGQDRRCHFSVGNFLNTLIMTVVAIAVTVLVPGGGLVASALMQTGMAATTAAYVSVGVSATMAAAQDAPNSKAFGGNCCKDFVIEGSDAWYKLGVCTVDEVRLAVAKRKGLFHYLGEYCSKKGGFPVKQCVERTRTYCTFDDMLALTVNEQGRAQLDAIAVADSTTTKSTAELDIKLYAPELPTQTTYAGLGNGSWVLSTNFNHSQVWTWQYAGYCRTLDKQKEAYALFEADVAATLNLQGIQPDKMTKEQAALLLERIAGLKPFQECPETPGMMSFLTCSKQDDSCDTTKLPAGPSGVDTDLTGAIVSESDVNWRIQQKQALYLPGDYGVTATMTSDASYAAVGESINESVTAVGSCHVDGNCKYKFAVTDKTISGGLGARKRIKDYAQFPLYTTQLSTAWPTIDYLAADGTLDMTAYNADPNLGKGTPTTVSTQRFKFHPNDMRLSKPSTVHSKVLLDWATRADTGLQGPDYGLHEYTPLLVPTSLPMGTADWWPHGDITDNTSHFYLSGGCDPNSRWCNYAIEVDLTIPRHPWGSAQAPRCWGFSMDQMAALDFDKMDLSKWVDSLNLDASSAGMTDQAATAMTNQIAQSTQLFYSTFQEGTAIVKPNGGEISLVVNTNTLPFLSSSEDGVYKVRAAVPANWPNWFDDQPNNNPVTNVWVDWGDGSPKQAMPRSAIVAPSTVSRAYDLAHDYGDMPVGTYKLTVTLDSLANGPQTMSTNIRIAPDAGEAPKGADLDFNNPGVAGGAQADYVPSMTTSGGSQAPANLQQLSPATVDQFDAQGNTINLNVVPIAPAP